MNSRIIPVTKPQEMSEEEWTRLQDLAKKQMLDAFRYRDQQMMDALSRIWV